MAVSIVLDYHDSIDGPIPSFLGGGAGINTVEWLDLGRSNLTGNIPESLGTLPNLRCEVVEACDDVSGRCFCSTGARWWFTESNRYPTHVDCGKGRHTRTKSCFRFAVVSSAFALIFFTVFRVLGQVGRKLVLIFLIVFCGGWSQTASMG